MYRALAALEAAGKPIRVALNGAGMMGVGIARQLRHTPGLELCIVSDRNIAAAIRGAHAYGADYKVVDSGNRLPPRGQVCVTDDPLFAIVDRPELRLDVVVEASSAIGPAGRYVETAVRNGLHAILMNAEVDLALGPYLRPIAERNGVIVSSDAGDQHGVLARMIDEIRCWGFEIAMAGNIKGFLDRHATAVSIEREARSRNLDPHQCCGQTDGTKLNIEMALIANGTGLVPSRPGMLGPRLADVEDVLGAFRFASPPSPGSVDYILGARPGGGLFVVGHCDDAVQQRYLSYYKMGDGPFYLFYRPYHLCHFETPTAIVNAVLHREAILRPSDGRVTDVFAYAKRDLAAGERVEFGIGSDQFYGMIDRTDAGAADGRVPITVLERDGDRVAVLRRAVRRDRPLRRDDLELPRTYLVDRYGLVGEAMAVTA